MAKKNISYADQARSILAKYPEHKTDKLQQESLTKELDALMEQQESFRQTNGLDQETQQFQYGGFGLNPDAAGYPLGPSYRGMTELSKNIPWSRITAGIPRASITGATDLGASDIAIDRNVPIGTTTPIIGQPFEQMRSQIDPLGNMIKSQALLERQATEEPISLQGYIPTSTQDIVPSSVGQLPVSTRAETPELLQRREAAPLTTAFTEPTAAAGLTQPRQFGEPQIPTGQEGFRAGLAAPIIGGATTVLGNLLMRRGVKPRQLTLPRAVADTERYTRQREDIRRRGQEAGRIAARNIRGLGTTGQQMMGQIATTTGLQRGVGEQLAGVYGAEQSYLDRIRQQNLQLAAQEQMANLQAQREADALRRQYAEAAISAVPATMRDIQARQQEANLLSILGDQYGVTQDPTQTRLGRMFAPRYQITQRQ